MIAKNESAPTVTLVDLQLQNILSVANALKLVGAGVRVARDPADFADAEFIVFPGVGSFAAAAVRLHERGIAAAIRDRVLDRGCPLVGLCLGMQLLANVGEEHGIHNGLGLVPGRVVKLCAAPPEAQVPNVGWRRTRWRGGDSQLATMVDQRDFYHVHSFHFRTDTPADTVATTHFGANEIAAMVQRDHIVGTQFHPEKSQEAGLDLLHALLCTLRNRKTYEVLP